MISIGIAIWIGAAIISYALIESDEYNREHRGESLISALANILFCVCFFWVILPAYGRRLYIEITKNENQN